MRNRAPSNLCLLVVFAWMFSSWTSFAEIKISSDNPGYWELEGEPVLLLGGSVEDNLFQIPNLEEHLDILRSVGGNYVRCTMSSRDEGNVWAFARKSDKYDLREWNEEYWRRFENFLRLTGERDIVVQIEVWATFDYYRDNWERNPFNPKNNVNYDKKTSGLPTKVNSHPVATQNNFFWSVPAENNQETVLEFQKRFLDKILSYSLKQDHVLYCMDNETAVTPEWGKFWSERIKSAAKKAGKSVETTEMWDPHNLDHPKHRATVEHPETYSFVDISQNNHQKGQRHWDNMQRQRKRVYEIKKRPLNNIKIYGSDDYHFGKDRDGQERFWRNVFGGCASSRLHRPPAGLGLSKKAQANIKSLRMLTDSIDVFACEPNNAILSNREENEAYCMATPGTEYAVYFTRGGEVDLDVSGVSGPLEVRWLEVLESDWKEPVRVDATKSLSLRCPDEGYWAVTVQAAQ